MSFHTHAKKSLARWLLTAWLLWVVCHHVHWSVAVVIVLMSLDNEAQSYFNSQVEACLDAFQETFKALKEKLV